MKKLFLTMFTVIAVALSGRGVTVANLWSTNELWLASQSLASNVVAMAAAAAAQTTADANSATGATHTAAISDVQALASTAIQTEQDIRALKNYHYGDPDITITPDSEFGFVPGTGTITNYTGTGANLVIPFEIGGYPVLAVADSVFLNKTNIVTAIGPRTLITFAIQAFEGCTAMTSVSLPAVTSFGDRAFYLCSSLETVSIPLAETFGTFAFRACSGLQNATLQASTNFGMYAFYNCPSLISVSLPLAETFGGFEFSLSALLTEVSLPSVSALGDYAFYECDSLTTINFSQSPPTIGADSYALSPSITNYVLDATATGWGTTFGGRPVVFPAVTASSVTSKGAVDIGGALTGTTATFSGVVKGATATESNDLVRLDQLNAAIAGAGSGIIDTINTSTATVTVDTAESVYKITTATAVTVTNNLSTISLSSEVARWEVWLDLTSTNALTSAFASNIDFGGCEPDLTVTGCYKFAMSTIDGSSITACQTYPTIYQKIPMSFNPDGGALSAGGNISTMGYRYSTSDTEKITIPNLAYDEGDDAYYKYEIKGKYWTSVQITNTTTAVTAIQNGSSTTEYSARITGSNSIVFAIPPDDSNIIYTYVYAVPSNPTIVYFKATKMNELEISAYADGWRP